MMANEKCPEDALKDVVKEKLKRYEERKPLLEKCAFYESSLLKTCVVCAKSKKLCHFEGGEDVEITLELKPDLFIWLINYLSGWSKKRPDEVYCTEGHGKKQLRCDIELSNRILEKSRTSCKLLLNSKQVNRLYRMLADSKDCILDPDLDDNN